jgi:hypothetical protein
MISLSPALNGSGRRVYTIVFTSNAPTPANFDGVETPALLADANQEIWIYRLPEVADMDLTTGADVPIPIDLTLGTFEQINRR